MLRKLVWYWVCARIAKQMWSEREYWFKPKPMTMKRMNELLMQYYVTPIREQLNRNIEPLFPAQSTYNVDRG